MGHNDERFGPRFPAVSKIYTRALRDRFKKIAADKHIEIKEGVYSSLGGPCYETVSEVRGLLMLGADAVGMSTAHEALVASYCGMKVFFVSLSIFKGNFKLDIKFDRFFFRNLFRINHLIV